MSKTLVNKSGRHVPEKASLALRLAPVIISVNDAMSYLRGQFHPEEGAWQEHCQPEIRETYNALRRALDHLEEAERIADHLGREGGPTL